MLSKKKSKVDPAEYTLNDLDGKNAISATIKARKLVKNMKNNNNKNYILTICYT